MTFARTFRKARPCGKWMTGLLGLAMLSTAASDWPQYRGPTHDGISTDRIRSQWNTNAPGFVVWRNASITNGFSSFAISQGRAFTLVSRNLGGLKEVCAAVDAATGTNLWATVIDSAPWDPTDTGSGDGSEGISPYNSGDGPRTTPSVRDGRVFALSGRMSLVCLNATNGSVMWSNNLVAQYGASEPNSWQNGASPRFDDDLIFVNLNTSVSGLTLFAFRTTNGSPAWSSQNENSTQATPVVVTIQGVRQVLFATATGIVSLDRSTGALLWEFAYPFFSYPTALGASPVVYSNIVFCSAGYGRGSAAATITQSGGIWTATQLWYKSSPALAYRSIWMTPVCQQGFLYGQFGDKNYVTSPLNCIELATGNLMWSTNNFGQGGTILANGKVLTVTEDGQLVLSQPNPSAYTELARFRAFDFNAASPGKCWNSPAVADGRIYARSTRGGICVDVSVSPLRMLAPQFAVGNRLQLLIGTASGSAVDSNRLARLEVRYTTNLATSLPNWTKLTNNLVLTNGVVRADNVDNGTARYFIASEQP
jgi:outer membrane protein assembly factor BamB